MKINNAYYILLALLILLTASCKKNFLDSKPLDQYSDADIWQDSTLASLFLNSAYASIPTEFAGVMRDAYSDQLYSTNNVSIYQDSYVASSVPFSIMNTWDDLYEAVRRCNIYIANVDRLPASDGFKGRTRDEARFLRALFYHYLMNYFGDVPIITVPQNLDDDLNVKRTPYLDGVAFLTEELDGLINAEYLPWKYDSRNTGRVTRGAAMSLKSRVLLYAASKSGDWQAAYDAAKAVIDHAGQAGYALFPNYQELFYETNDNNSEVIFDHQYQASFQAYHVHHYNLPWGLTPPGPAGLNQPTQNIVDEYELTNGKLPKETGSGYDAQQPYINRDPRFYASIFFDGDNSWKGITLDLKLGSAYNPSFNPTATGYYLKKMIDPAFDPFNTTTSYGPGNNNIILRYAEILLNAAEAAYELGHVEEARGYVNQIRSRPSVAMPVIAAAGFNLEKIRHERNIELAFEGTRTWDIRRWEQGPEKLGVPTRGIGIEEDGAGNRTYSETVVIERPFSDKHYLIPIYQTEMDKNPNLQPNNPGW
ncbi:RagB/SusD family nutrient uptake outer membrane protein [Parapedobacter tibetensis]|uniref:RagB/SusD family nutrient uptake outer membrane protein n=1 Tax=Parapedobacter tibetensis TaxID=2972951 RepID=UPI00214D8443|nr:RagB/SusD family nutrient uptake outer membrane protein [Parapedobacter tibetensis]